MDLIRNIHDPQAASKALVDHALNRFSTDNLSCMVVRYNSQVVSDTISSKLEPIGVEGDPSTKVRGGVTESEAIVGAAKRSMGGEVERPRASNDLARMNTPTIMEQAEDYRNQEPGPELDPEGLKNAQEKAAVGQTIAQQPEGAPPPEIRDGPAPR